MRVNSDTDLSGSDVWSTPPELFAAAAALYGPFDVDCAANAQNHLLDAWLGPGGMEEDALTYDGSGFGRPPKGWGNWPYSRGNLDRFMGWARSMVLRRRFALITCLVPGHTAEGWWHRHVERAEGRLVAVTAGDSLIGRRVQQRFDELVIEQLRIKGRVRFVEASGATGSARFPSVLVTYARPDVLGRLERRRGRPQAITSEIDARVRELVDGGAPLQDALDQAGVNRRTWYRHLERRRGAA